MTDKVAGGTRFLDKIGNGTCNEKEDIGPSDMPLDLQTSCMEDRRYFSSRTNFIAISPLMKIFDKGDKGTKTNIKSYFSCR